MASALLGGDVPTCAVRPSVVTTVKLGTGESCDIVCGVDRSSGGLQRRVYMYKTQVIGATPWIASGIPAGAIEGTSAEIEELVHGEVVSVFNVAGEWLFAMGEAVDSSKHIGPPGTSAYATLRACIPNNVATLGIVPSRSYAFVVQRQGKYKSWVFARSRLYCVCVWNRSEGGLKPISRDQWNIVGCSYVRTFSAQISSVIAEHCIRLTPSSCSGLVFELDGKLQKVVNGERLRYESLQSDATAQLAQYISAEHGGLIRNGDVVISTKDAALYMRYVNAVWAAYMSQHVWKPACKCTNVFKTTVAALHTIYIALIGTPEACITRKRVKEYLKSRCAVSVAKSIVTWQRVMLDRVSIP